MEEERGQETGMRSLVALEEAVERSGVEYDQIH